MTGVIRSYRDLQVWQHGLEFVLVCYRIAATFPEDERFGLRSQLQRAAVSVPANIAEGQGRWYAREFLRYLSNAHGSLAECETHLHLALRLGYLQEADAQPAFEAARRVGKMLHGLKRALVVRLQ